MKTAVFGTGIVGMEIAGKLLEKGHEVMMGARQRNNEKATMWSEAHGENAFHGTFADAAAFADEIIFNCTKGEFALDVLNQAGKEPLDQKILIDISNPLDFSQGMPPSLSICNTDSLAEQLQHAFPELKVVKTLNTMNCQIMLNPAKISGVHHAFLSGNDADAKQKVMALMQDFGWNAEMLIDLGDITTARGTEMLLPVWLRLYQALGTANFNFSIVK